MPRTTHAVPILVAFTLAVPAAAQPPPWEADARLAALVDEALAKNPDVLAASEAVAAAEARPDQARALADPALAINYTNDGWSPSLGDRDMTTLGVMASQTLPWPGKRRLRGDMAVLDVEQAKQELQRVRLSVAASVKRAYASLVLARELMTLVVEQEEIWRQIEGVARARYGVGQGAQQDVLRVQVELTRAQQVTAQQEAETTVRLAELNRLLARSGDQPVETPAQLSPGLPVRSREDSLRRAEETSPELRAAAAAIERDRLALRLAEKEGKPDLTVQAGYMNRGGLDSMWQAGVAFNLPVRGRRLAGARAEAEARARASERRLESIRLKLRFRTEERLAQLAVAETTARLYGDGIVPQDRMSVEAAVASYEAGKVPFVAVLEALNTLYQDRSTHLRVLAGRLYVLASLEEASLEATSEMPSGGGMGGGRVERNAIPGTGSPAAMTGMGR